MKYFHLLPLLNIYNAAFPDPGFDNQLAGIYNCANLHTGRDRLSNLKVHIGNITRNRSCKSRVIKILLCVFQNGLCTIQTCFGRFKGTGCLHIFSFGNILISIQFFRSLHLHFSNFKSCFCSKYSSLCLVQLVLVTGIIYATDRLTFFYPVSQLFINFHHFTMGLAGKRDICYSFQFPCKINIFLQVFGCYFFYHHRKCFVLLLLRFIGRFFINGFAFAACRQDQHDRY